MILFCPDRAEPSRAELRMIQMSRTQVLTKVLTEEIPAAESREHHVFPGGFVSTGCFPLVQAAGGNAPIFRPFVSVAGFSLNSEEGIRRLQIFADFQKEDHDYGRTRRSLKSEGKQLA